jgi:hypothetical protein
MGKRGQVSVRRDTYTKIEQAARARGMSVSAFVESVVNRALDAHEVLEEGGRPKIEALPAPFFCASCGKVDLGVPFRMPWGRDGALVDACDPCVNEHPRSGRYGYGEAGKPAGGSGFSGSGKAGGR